MNKNPSASNIFFASIPTSFTNWVVRMPFSMSPAIIKLEKDTPMSLIPLSPYYTRDASDYLKISNNTNKRHFYYE